MQNVYDFKGLRSEEVSASRIKNGKNVLELSEDRVFLHVIKEVVLEPMFILLVVSCTVYFMLHEQREGLIMLTSIFIVAGISFFQEYRSRNAIHALRKLSSPKATVIRDGGQMQIVIEEIVVDDVLLAEEGEVIPADGVILSSNDFSVNESIITGESLSVYKSNDGSNNVYKGTLVTSGSAYIRVLAVGIATTFGKIGLSLEQIEVEKTPLQVQIKSFVKYMVWIGAVAFLLVVTYNTIESKSLLHGLVHGLTLAMSILPEEIPVAFSTFQALGAFRLLKKNIIVKQPQYVETLGSATVICVDKTGTLTENRMEIAFIYDADTKASYDLSSATVFPNRVLEYAMWASETQPFDPMEKEIHNYYEKMFSIDKRPEYQQVHEYSLEGTPPIMTHIFKNKHEDVIIACKGAPEGILRQSTLLEDDRELIANQAKLYAEQGFRVLGVGKGIFKDNNLPLTQEEFRYEFLGLIAFYDPPKENIKETLDIFYKAGIKVKMITGDYAATAQAIARQVHFQGYENCLTGQEIVSFSADELREKVKTVNILARMFPEAKLKIIEALKSNGEVVAMTGDGVNDAPALKASQIGIAMGKHGSEVARGAASLIITDDDLFHMTEAVALGRKIYDNLHKAIQYIVSIHIPIILIVTAPLILMWKYPNIFTPVHVIFLEIIMGPTCSIIYENEEMEKGIMFRPPRKLTSVFLSFRQLSMSIIQGLVIAAGCLFIGYYFMRQSDETTVRTVVFITLLFSNIFLTLVNRSFYFSIITTVRYKNNLVPVIIILTVLLIASSLYLPFGRELFNLHPLSIENLAACVMVALFSTCWVEIFKWTRRRNKQPL
ncbi:cation-translocating P-type ATPase [Segetibacter koreensis]|uniref:cation-translocating P-type ATPase n=1 Tax=Segetibacter koreensis TaxID=398037 RepID=UPI0003749D39|nr:cation-translocating P-type ATPase [Segetibacter koreensis]